MLIPNIDNPMNMGHRVLKRKSRCVADVLLNHDRILKFRDLEMSWSDIATIMKMSTVSLRNAVKQINKLNQEVCDKPNSIRPKLVMYFASEHNKQEFIDWVRSVKKDTKDKHDRDFQH